MTRLRIAAWSAIALTTGLTAALHLALWGQLVARDPALAPGPALLWLDVATGAVLLLATGVCIDLVLRLRRKSAELQASEERFRDIFENTSDLIITVDAAGHISWVNPAWQRRLGYSEEQAVGRNCFDFLAPESREHCRTTWAAVMAGHATESTDAAFVTRSGDRILAELSISPRLHNGRPAGARAILRDVTARRAAETRLRDSEERFQQMATAMREVFWMTDAAGMTVYVSPAYEQVWGRTRESLLTNPASWFETLHPDDRERVRAAHVELRRDRRPLDIEYRILHPDGSLRHIRDRWYPVFDPGGQLTRVTGMAEDVTAAKEAIEQLRRKEAEVAHLQRVDALGRLAGGVAHEFNNLLTIILGHTALLREKTADSVAAQADAMEIERASHRAAAMTRRLLAFGRRQALDPRVLNLNAVLADSQRMLQRLIGEHVELAISASPDLWPVRVDPASLDQVIVNLAVNARDAMPSGGKLTLSTANIPRERRLPIHAAAPAGELVLLQVTDTGTGMDETTLSHMFEPFFSTKEAGGGSGLGLSTVYGIVRQSGGDIRVESAPGKGTAFRIYLPRTTAAAEEVRPSGSWRSQGSGNETILLVEDEDDLRKLIRQLLAGAGHLVLEARGAQEALALAETHAGPIHMLLTDVIMPGMGGSELVRRLQPRYRGLKVLFVTGYAPEFVTGGEKAANAHPILQKPFSPAHLVRRVREILDEPVREVRPASSHAAGAVRD